MELTYQSPMRMPAAYAAISEDEMTYIEGGVAISMPTTQQVLGFALNVAVNFVHALGRGAFNTAWSELKTMHDDGLSLSGSVRHYWGRQTPSGKVATVIVSGFAGFYVYTQTMQIINTVVSIYKEIKDVYEQSKADKAAEQAAASVIPDTTLAVA